jgi:hypothetical protein
MICIGYIGVETFDIILYIGKIISILNYPVLIIDLSGTEALTETIYHGMDLDSKDDIVQYRDINYTRRIPDVDELREFDDGVIFVVYGLSRIESYPIHPDYLNIIINPYPHIIKRVNRALYNNLTEDMKVRALVRDIVTIDDFDRAREAILPELSSIRTRYLFYDINDYENALKCQISQSISFKRISAGMKKIIMSELRDIFPKLKPSVLRRAFSIARKGEKHR